MEGKSSTQSGAFSYAYAPIVRQNAQNVTLKVLKLYLELKLGFWKKNEFF